MSVVPSTFVVLGTMTFGWAQASTPVTDKDAIAQIELFLRSLPADGKPAEIDTARMYADGETERMLGRILGKIQFPLGMTLATKAGPWTKGHSGTGNLKRCDAYLADSLERCKVDAFGVFYLHAPDPDSDLAEVVTKLQALYREGKFKALGLSNFSAWETMHLYYLCKKIGGDGGVLPSVCQMMYNALTREVERELIPCCRRLGIRVLAYNATAGGMLTDKYDLTSYDPNAARGRFAKNKNYQLRYWKDCFKEAVMLIQRACKAHEITTAAAAVRWLKHHAQLDIQVDGILLGASTVPQLQETLDAALLGEPLPAPVVTALDEGWRLTKLECPSYERGYCSFDDRTKL